MTPQILRHDRTQFMDLEMLCWPNKTCPPGQSRHIIQIGIVEVDNQSLEITESAGYYVRPNYNQFEVSDYCERLTGITRELLTAQGRPLQEVLRTIQNKHSPRHKVTYAWGDDNEPIKQHCAAHALPNPWGATGVWDFGVYFRSAFNIQKRLPLTAALRYLNIEFEGSAHDAVNDSRNLARLYIAMMQKLRDNQ